MVVEPPGDFGRGGVFEVDDGVLVAGEFALVKEGAGAVDEAVVFVNGVGRDALAMEAGEQRSRAGSVKAFVVIEDANPQECTPLVRTLERMKLNSLNS